MNIEKMIGKKIDKGMIQSCIFNDIDYYFKCYPCKNTTVKDFLLADEPDDCKYTINEIEVFVDLTKIVHYAIQVMYGFRQWFIDLWSDMFDFNKFEKLVFGEHEDKPKDVKFSQTRVMRQLMHSRYGAFGDYNPIKIEPIKVDPIKVDINKIYPTNLIHELAELERKKKEEIMGIDKLIKFVTVNEKKRIITVVFKDGDVRMIKCSDDDTFDTRVGVALCIAHHYAGSKTKFNKYIKALNTKKNNKK